MTKPIAIYLRVSDKDQSHESQRLDVDRYLEREGIDLSRIDWYTDTSTGRNLDRPELTRLRGNIRVGHHKMVIVYAIDRISREFFEGLQILGEWLKSGVRVASVTEPIDLSGEIGQAMAAVLFAFASIAWRQRKDRQKSGIEIARRKGVYQGAKPGYRKARPDRVAELVARGLTCPEIGKALGISVSTVARYARQSKPIDECLPSNDH